MRKEIESRLIRLSVDVNSMAGGLGRSILSQYLSEQMIRSSTSAALNYGEAQSAESKKDFIHKTSIVLKELRETSIGLRILSESRVVQYNPDIARLIDECNQLTAIFQKTVTTARSRG